MRETVLNNQSLLDFAIQHTGSVLNAFKISVANGIAITDDLIPGSVLIIPDNVVNDEDVLNYYKANKIQPATAATIPPLPTKLEGVGYWYIEKDFKIS